MRYLRISIGFGICANASNLLWHIKIGPNETAKL